VPQGGYVRYVKQARILGLHQENISRKIEISAAGKRCVPFASHLVGFSASKKYARFLGIRAKEECVADILYGGLKMNDSGSRCSKAPDRMLQLRG
jgi:hypothetical protein